MSATPAYEFLARPPRTAKPRKRGLTVVSDKAKSLAQSKDIIETVSEVIDHIKIPDHVGVMWRYPAELVRSKNTLYAEAGIRRSRAAYLSKWPRCRERSRSTWNALPRSILAASK